MIRLRFRLPQPGSPWRETWEDAKSQDAAAIGETTLRYSYFGVNAELVVDGTQIISDEGFVTLVDLALSIAGAVARISAGADAAIGFTESDHVVRFHLDGDRVLVSSSRSSEQPSADREELLTEFSEFLIAARARLVAEIPGLGANPAIQRIVNTA